MEETRVENPNYYAIIPASVRYDKDLSASQKIFYGEIVALSTKNGICTASNNYFASLYNVVPSSISNWIKQLELLNYIKVDYVYKENSKEIDKRIIKIVGIQNTDKVFNKLQEGIQKKSEGYSKNTKDNNTRINNTSINNKENIKRKYYENLELNDLFNEFLDLRKKLKAQNTERAINNLLNELSKYNDNEKKQMINNSITNSWKSVYPLKNRAYQDKQTREEEAKRKFLEVGDD